MTQQDKKTFLFDFDGTLVDSMPTFAKVMLRILDENGVKYGSDIIKIITPLGYKGAAEYFIKIGVDMGVDALVKKMISYVVYEYENNIQAKDTVTETLHQMKARGDSLNVLTASPHDALDPCLKRLGIWELFDNVWSCDDFNTTKANPQIYAMAADRLGKSVSEIIFVDDNVNAVKTAKTAGMMAYGIFDKSSEDYIEEFKSVADRYVMDFCELYDAYTEKK